jgi:hypothetical protein
VVTEDDHDQEMQQPEFGLEDNLDADHDEDAPLHFNAVSGILGPSSPHGMAERHLGNQILLVASAEELGLLVEVEQQIYWRRAMEMEMKSIEDNGT